MCWQGQEGALADCWAEATAEIRWRAQRDTKSENGDQGLLGIAGSELAPLRPKLPSVPTNSMSGLYLKGRKELEKNGSVFCCLQQKGEKET